MDITHKQATFSIVSIQPVDNISLSSQQTYRQIKQTAHALALDFESQVRMAWKRDVQKLFLQDLDL